MLALPLGQLRVLDRRHRCGKGSTRSVAFETRHARQPAIDVCTLDHRHGASRHICRTTRGWCLSCSLDSIVAWEQQLQQQQHQSLVASRFGGFSLESSRTVEKRNSFDPRESISTQIYLTPSSTYSRIQIPANKLAPRSEFSAPSFGRLCTGSCSSGRMMWCAQSMPCGNNSMLTILTGLLMSRRCCLCGASARLGWRYDVNSEIEKPSLSGRMCSEHGSPISTST